MGRRGKARHFREIDGVLILDKPAGMTSNAALQRARRLLLAEKAGHCGSLDPMATGVLPIAFGQATRYAGYLLGAGKRYRATCRLGQTTTTADAEGELLVEKAVRVDRSQVLDILARFVGDIDQVPPMYSALKRDGKRLYQLAREGLEVAREPRRVTISRLELLEFDGQSIEFDVDCSKGTYVRTLAEDIGAALGCGAHLTALRRTAVEGIGIDAAITLDALEALDAAARDARLEPVTRLLEAYAELRLDRETVLALVQGRTPAAPSSAAPGLYRLLSDEARFIGLGEVLTDGGLRAKRLMNTAR